MRYLLLADGSPLPRAELDRLRRGRFVIAIDGAAERARKEGWTPGLLSGDFDSVRDSTLAHFRRRKVPILPTPDQDFTDLEKALRWAVEEGATSLWVTQGIGKRLDHSLGSLALLKRFHHPKRELLLLTETETVRFARDETLTLKGKRGRGFALIPFPRAVVTTRGLAYEMKNTRLFLGMRESVSNRAEKSAILVKIRGEALVIEERK